MRILTSRFSYMLIRSFAYTLVASSLLLTACGSERKKEVTVQQQNAGKRPPVRADAYIVGTSVLLDKIEVPGSIVANETTEVHPEVAGRIVRVYFSEGAYVRKGALLAKLNDDDLQAQKRKLQVQLQIAKQNEDRSSELLKIQGISRQDYDATVLQVSNINADLAIIQAQIEKTNVRAPFTGKVGFKMVSDGAYVSPASTITTISQTSQLKIEFTIPEKYISRVHNGQYVNFQVEGNNRNYAARVSASEPNISASTRTLQVRANVQGDQGGLTPGNFARVTVNFAPDNEAIMVPSQAIIPQARGKKVYLYQGGIAKFVDVETGLRDSSRVQVLSGLNPGDTVLITGLLSVKPDAKVTLNQVVNGTGKASADSAQAPAKKDNG